MFSLKKRFDRHEHVFLKHSININMLINIDTFIECFPTKATYYVEELLKII